MKYILRNDTLLLSKAIAAALFTAGYSSALYSQESKIDESDFTLEEIVVTAEKRESSLQDTPLAISAFSGDQLDKLGISSGEDLQFHVPGLTFGKTVTRTSQVTLRGVGSENINPGGDPGVAVHVGGAYQQFTGFIAQDFFDVERIEVLRGPQGTLYGRNATGGSINIIPNAPTEEFQGHVKLGFGDYGQIKTQGVVSGSLIDNRLKGRLSVDKEKRDGYTNNTFNGDEIDDKDYTAVRAQLEYTVSDSLSVHISAHTYSDDSSGVPLSSTSENPTGPLFTGLDLATFTPVFSNFFVSNNAQPNIALSDARKVRHNTPTEGREDTDGITLVIAKEFDAFSIKSTTSANETEYLNRGDTDSSAEVNFFQTTAGAYDTLSQEIQISSDAGDGLEWTAGLYFYQEESDYNFNITLGDSVDLPTPFLGVPVTFDAGGKVDAKSIAAFGQLNYSFNDALSITLGVRSTKDEKDLDETVLAPAFGIADFATFGPLVVQQSEDWGETTGKIGLQYQPAENVLLYASISTGFKAGGFNVSGLQSGYDPETLTAFEGGMKSTLIDGKVRFNAAAFYYDYDDLQVFQIESVQASITNAAKAESFGLELELMALITENFQIDASLAYLDAAYKEFSSADPIDPTATLQDLSGNNLPRSPEVSFNLGLEYTWYLDDLGSVTARVATSYMGEQYFRPFNLDQDKQDSYSKSDARLTWNNQNEAWQVEVFVKNIEDEDTISNIIVAAATLGSLPLASYNQPRTYGVSALFRF